MRKDFRKRLIIIVVVPYAHRDIKGGIRHNLPQEAPEAFARAIIDVDAF